MIESGTITFMSIISKCTEITLNDAVASLIEGYLVAFPTETVYGLGADATNKDAVARIYEVKDRPVDHPLIVHISSIEHLDKWARDIPEYAIKLARMFWPGPMTLILPRTELAKDFITGNQDNIGVRVPSNKVAIALLKKFEAKGGFGIAAPSANRFGSLSPTTAEAVTLELGKYLCNSDMILDGGESLVGVESTIIDCSNTNPIILRPGAITKIMVEEITGVKVLKNQSTNNIKASGLLKSHYSPIGRVHLSGTPKRGDGFLALASIITPPGAIRIGSPRTNIEFAKLLYAALRFADSQNLKDIYVVSPVGEDIAVAINDRLTKAAYEGGLVR